MTVRRVAIETLYHGLYDGPHATPKPSEDGPVFLGIGNITEDGKLDLNDIRHIAEEDYPSWTKRVTPQPGDIVFTYEATLNRYAIIPGGFRGCLGRRTALIRPNPDAVNSHFLFFYFFSEDWRKTISENILAGATVDRIPLTRFPTFPVTVPERAVQDRIAAILSAYDDLIENNTRRIKVVKAIAQTIFQGALSTFPDLWANVPIEEVYEELFDGPHATPKPSASGPIYLGIKNVTERGELDLTETRHIAEEDFSQWTRRVVPRPGDIVFTYEATLNRYAIINRDFRGCLGRRMALIRPDERQIDPYLFLHCLLSDQWRNEVRSKIISGATVDRIPLTTFPTFRVQVPTPDLRARIGPAIRACEELAENCRRRNDVLRTTRDLLLPKLISGELPVQAAAEAMEQTA